MNNHNSLGSWHIQLFIDLYGVVINFLPVSGPGHNILRLEAACSPAINHENQGRAELFLLYHLELFTAAMIRADGGRGDRWVLRKHETHLYVTDCYSVFVFLGPPTNCAITLVTYATYKDSWFAWSIGIDPTEVSSMKLILFIVYVSTDGPLRRTRRSPPSDCGSSADLWRETPPRGGGGGGGGCINFHHNHSFAVFCFVYIKLNCNASPERYNWPQSQIKWL